MVRWIAAAAALLTGLSACSVDLTRSAGLLRIVVENPDPMARAVRVVLDDAQEDEAPLEPYVLEVGLDASTGPGTFTLPDLSVASGPVRVRVETLTEGRAVVGSARSTTVLLEPEATTTVVFDFGATTPAPTVGTVEETLTLRATPSSWGMDGERFTAELPVEARALEAVLASAERRLGVSSTTLGLRSLRLEVRTAEAAGTEVITFEDLWESPATVSVRSRPAGPEVTLGMLPADARAEADLSLATTVDVTEWLVQEAEPTLVFRGTTQDDGFPFTWTAQLRLRVH